MSVQSIPLHTPPSEYEHSQLRWIDTRDAEYWRDYKRKKEEEEKKAQEVKAEPLPEQDDKVEEPVDVSSDTSVTEASPPPDAAKDHHAQTHQDILDEQEKEREEQVIYTVPRRLTEYEEDVLGMRQW
jgi:hypothetical protein